jgi:hypothetical protein
MGRTRRSLRGRAPWVEKLWGRRQGSGTIVAVRNPIVEPGIPLDWRVLLSGYFPDYAYDHKALDQSLPFAARLSSSAYRTTDCR